MRGGYKYGVCEALTDSDFLVHVWFLDLTPVTLCCWYSFMNLTATDLFPLSNSSSELDQGPGYAQENEYSKSR